MLSAFESSGLTIGCTVLYPEQFDALRRTCDCEKSMIESLARCIKWHASGGKSGSAFLKTLGMRKFMDLRFALTFDPDDRFIAKEISRAELQTMETFAPAYFDYMSSSLTAGVCGSCFAAVLSLTISAAPNVTRQDIWMLQSHIQNHKSLRAGKTENHTDEPRCDGKPILRSPILQGSPCLT